MWNVSEDRQVYQRAGESWAGIGNILLNVLYKTADYSIGGKGEEEEVQNLYNIIIGVCYLQGAYLYEVLEGETCIKISRLPTQDPTELPIT